jgi:hypothetical protein
VAGLTSSTRAQADREPCRSHTTQAAQVRYISVAASNVHCGDSLFAVAVINHSPTHCSGCDELQVPIAMPPGGCRRPAPKPLPLGQTPGHPHEVGPSADCRCCSAARMQHPTCGRASDGPPAGGMEAAGRCCCCGAGWARAGCSLGHGRCQHDGAAEPGSQRIQAGQAAGSQGSAPTQHDRRPGPGGSGPTAHSQGPRGRALTRLPSNKERRLNSRCSISSLHCSSCSAAHSPL